MNVLKRPRLDRRTLLRGAGTIAIALPWLEIMGAPQEAQAQAAGTAKRFLTVYTPGGTVLNKFWPTVATDPSSSPILAPLAPLASKLAVLEGLDYKCKEGEQHQAGIIAFQDCGAFEQLCQFARRGHTTPRGRACCKERRLRVLRIQLRYLREVDGCVVVLLNAPLQPGQFHRRRAVVWHAIDILLQQIDRVHCPAVVGKPSGLTQRIACYGVDPQKANHHDQHRGNAAAYQPAHGQRRTLSLA